MTITKTLKLNVCDFDKPRLLNIFLELFEPSFSSKKLGSSDMQFCDLSRIEDQCHF